MGRSRTSNSMRSNRSGGTRYLFLADRAIQCAARNEGPAQASKSVAHNLGDTIMRHQHTAATVAVLAILAVSGQALADPCGMVPPIYVTDNNSLVRVGDEQTYVFFKDGLETFVIRPGFSGKVEDFGMLISFH